MCCATHVGQRSCPLPSPPLHWVAPEANFMLAPSPLSYTLLTTLIFPMRNLAPATLTQLLMCASLGMYRAELVSLFAWFLTPFSFWFVPTNTRQGILRAICHQQPWQRKGVACQFKQGASQDHHSQHPLQCSWGFSWWQCHYHWYACCLWSDQLMWLCIPISIVMWPTLLFTRNE